MGRSVVMFCMPLRLRAVKAVVQAPDGRVLIVRHSYGSGRWMFPGGLVRRGEPFASAVGREMEEELGVDVEEWALLAEFTHRYGLTRQRLGVLGAVVDPSAVTTNREIAEVRFVDPALPPDDTSPATLRRLDELASGGLSGGAW
jgi:8-oxo-dGTP pyrophosphatase MutT (NUDIX family)